jgi:hypothetical protein
VARGEEITWGDGTCTDTAWHATNLLGDFDFYPDYGDSNLGWDKSHENAGKEFIELRESPEPNKTTPAPLAVPYPFSALITTFRSAFTTTSSFTGSFRSIPLAPSN